MLAGATAGFCQVIATNPMEIVKIRMQMSNGSTSMVQTVKDLGLRGLYRGTAATLSRDVPFSLLFFQTSASLRSTLGRMASQEGGQESVEVVFLAGIFAGSLAAFLVTPMDVVKTRLQSASAASGLVETYRSIYEKEGFRAFFRGSIQRCFIVAPLFGITLLVYEAQKSYLKDNKH